MKPVNPRRLFLSKIGALGLASIFPFSKRLAAVGVEEEIPEACLLIPAETRGPFPLFGVNDISSQSALVRSNIKETQSGVPLDLRIIVRNSDCAPVPGAKVHIWQCNKDGLYSGYSTGLNPGQAGLTYLRGIQVTDATGQVRFTTIFPGWYNGRLTHIHVEVFVEDVLLHTSQFAFPLETEAGSATALVNESYGRSNGNIVRTYSADAIFQDGYQQQLLSLTGSVTSGYTATHIFTINDAIVRLKIRSFTAGIENKNVMLWWVIENDYRAVRFEIQKSDHPSKNFQSIGSVNVINGGIVNNYSFNVPGTLPAGVNYFRLRIIYTNGSSFFSASVALNVSTVETLALVNSSVTNELVIRHPALYRNSMLKIANMNGQLVATGRLKTGVSLTSIDVQQFVDGAYFLIIESGIDRFVTKFYKGH